MSNYRNAPKLKFQGAKKLDNQHYQLPQDVMDIVFQKLGNSSAQLRLMVVLIGTREDFAVSEKWICERCNLKQPSYVEARKKLVERGWLTHEKGSITVNFDAIRAEAK